MENITNILNLFFKDLKFVKSSHKYYLNKKAFSYSVSNIVNDFITPFPAEKISKNISIRDNISQKEILDSWQKTKDIACDKGTAVHKFAEKYFYDKTIQAELPEEKAVIKFFSKKPANIDFVLPELKMYYKILNFAGTADLILYNKNTKKFIIGDYKTNKDIFKNFNGKRMINRYSNLLDTPYNHYLLQLSLYQILFEQTNFRIENRFLIWLKDTGNFEIFSLKDMTKGLKIYLQNNKKYYGFKRNNTKSKISVQ